MQALLKYKYNCAGISFLLDLMIEWIWICLPFYGITSRFQLDKFIYTPNSEFPLLTVAMLSSWGDK